MSARKKKAISEEISDMLKPREMLDPEKEQDETTAMTKFGTWSDEEEQVEQQSRQLSEFRKMNVKDLTKGNKKYTGEVVSRRDLQESDEDSDLENDGEVSDLENNNDDSDLEEEEYEDSVSDEEEENSDEEGEAEETEEDEEIDSDEAEEGFTAVQPQDGADNIKKGEAVKNQLKIWEKLLEMRIKAQKVLQCGNSFPSGDVYQSLAQKEEFPSAVDSAAKSLSGLIEKLLALRQALLENFPETRGIKRKAEDDSLETQIADDSFREFRNATLRKWHDRTRLVSGAKGKQAETQDIIQKIENSMANKMDLVRKTRTYRGNYEVVGREVQEGDCLPEIYDDGEFYLNLLRELIEYKSSESSNPELDQKFIELQSLRSKMKKKVDTRASKGRKIRYVVHNKMVNFMAPETHEEWTDEAKDELFSSLFDKATS